MFARWYLAPRRNSLIDGVVSILDMTIRLLDDVVVSEKAHVVWWELTKSKGANLKMRMRVILLVIVVYIMRKGPGQLCEWQEEPVSMRQ